MEGERAASAVAAIVVRTVASEPAVALEYVEVRDAHDLSPASRLDGDVLVALAARVGETRLIDNVLLSVRAAGATADLGSGTCNAR